MAETKENAISVNELRTGHHDGTSWNSTPNSAGGVSVRILFSNRCSTPIKYIVFVLVPYNNVGDTVTCTISRKSEARARATGPYEYNKYYRPEWENLWYHPCITSAKLTRVEIEYMDGSKKEIDGSEIEIPNVKGGCYIATAVYGSYDCPEVWTLRRFRDNSLARTWYGRALIKTYYAISPTVVRLFGNRPWFNRFWHDKLNQLVTSLKQNGYSDKPYSDE